MITLSKCLKKYTVLTIKQKIDIIRFGENNKCLSGIEIAKIFSEKFKKPVSQRTVNDIRKNSEKYLKNVDLNSVN